MLTPEELEELRNYDVRLAVERVKYKKMFLRWNAFAMAFNLLLVNFQIYNLLADYTARKPCWHYIADSFCLLLNSLCLFTSYKNRITK